MNRDIKTTTNIYEMTADVIYALETIGLTLVSTENQIKKGSYIFHDTTIKTKVIRYGYYKNGYSRRIYDNTCYQLNKTRKVKHTGFYAHRSFHYETTVRILHPNCYRRLVVESLGAILNYRLRFNQNAYYNSFVNSFLKMNVTCNWYFERNRIEKSGGSYFDIINKVISEFKTVVYKGVSLSVTENIWEFKGKLVKINGVSMFAQTRVDNVHIDKNSVMITIIGKIE